MYKVDIDTGRALISFKLDGLVRGDEMKKFYEEMKAAALSLSGREIKIKADLRTFRPTSPEAAETVREMQIFGMKVGVTRVAELVESEMVALQLNRLAHESGSFKILRRFTDEDAALRWLLSSELSD